MSTFPVYDVIYQDKGSVNVPTGSRVKFMFKARMPSVITLCQRNPLTQVYKGSEGSSVEFTPNREYTYLIWFVFPRGEGPWSYEVIIMANGKEVYRETSEIRGKFISVQECILIQKGE